MNAIEFVEKFGLDKANQAVYRDAAPYAKAVCVHNGELTFSVSMGGSEWVLIKDLKQIVDAFELVEAWGGIDRTKDRIEWAIVNKNYYAADMMKHSINLVEQCQND